MNEQLTKNFTLREFYNTSHRDLFEANKQDAIKVLDKIILTASLIQSIRDFLNIPLLITSGFRNEILNVKVGGSPTSSHKLGKAIDVVPKGKRVSEVFDILLENSEKFPMLRKVIYEEIGRREWLHIEVKESADEPTEFFITNNGRNYTKIK